MELLLIYTSGIESVDKWVSFNELKGCSDWPHISISTETVHMRISYGKWNLNLE